MPPSTRPSRSTSGSSAPTRAADGPDDALPLFGTVPIGPDEPELFVDAMERILDHLGNGAYDAAMERAERERGEPQHLARDRGESQLPKRERPVRERTGRHRAS